MSYKSYAQGGQFNTYSIDLPIKTEINEDLRAAGDFANQMERSQQYREKWAHTYLSALNIKSNIERQNRDDNFEFLQNNFKRIYEGEQREFEGRMGELRREQHEAANAEPGFIEKLIPLLIDLAPKALAVVGQMQAANTEKVIAEKNKVGQQIVQYYNGLNKPGESFLNTQREIGLLGEPEARARAYQLADQMQLAGYETSQESIANFLIGNGEHTFATQSLSMRRMGQNNRGRIADSIAGLEVKDDQGVPIKSLHISNFSSQREQDTAISNQLYKFNEASAGGNKAYWEYGEHVRADLDKNNARFLESITSRERSSWGQRYELVNNQVSDQEWYTNNKNGTLPTLLEEMTFVEVGRGTDPATARLLSLDTIKKNHTIENGGSASDWREFGNGMAKKLGLKNIPEAKGDPGYKTKFWHEYRAHLVKLEQDEVGIRNNQAKALTAQSQQIIETGKQFTLNHSVSESLKYWQQWQTSNKFPGLPAETQKYINKMASGPQHIREFLNTTNSFEAKSGLTASDQKSIVIQNLAGDLGQGAAGKGWEDRNLTLINKTMSYAKIKFQEIKQENPGLHNSVAYERAVVEAWTEMTGPKGNIKIIPGETAADPVTTNYSSGADIYKKEVNSKTNFTQRINTSIKSGSKEYLRWNSMNSNGILKSINTTNTLYKQENPSMDITAPMVREAIYSPWIQTIATEYRKAGIVKSGSQILNEQGEAWAKETGQKWTPIDYVTEADLNNARARARRDLEQIYNHSATEQVNQAHLNHQKGEPYKLNPYATQYKGVGIADYKQRPVEFAPETGRRFETMNAAYIAETGDQGGLGPGISSSLRREADTARLIAEGNPNVAPHDQSNHPKGKAFDINWNSLQGIWIRNNAHRFGFKHNNYNGSTHFDDIGGN